MRLTEIFYFLKNNPTNEEFSKFSRLDIKSVKKEIENNKDLKNLVKISRKKELNYEDDIFS